MKKRVAIFVHGQCGDIMSATSVFKYSKELWGDCDIIWYASMENLDIFKHQDIEVREFPRGFGYPEMVVEENRKLIESFNEPIWADYKPLVDENNHMDIELKNSHHELDDIDIGFFPAPHQVPHAKRLNTEYPNVSKKVFSIPDDWEWHPVLMFSDEEIQKAKEFINGLPNRKNICLETFGGSSQSILSDSQVRRTMQHCRTVLGDCNFIFLSHKYLNGNEIFPDGWFEQEGVYSASHFTVRQCALVVALCDLFVSVSSGISVAAQCWHNKGSVPPIIQYCGSAQCSTKAFASNTFELIETYNKSVPEGLIEYETKLINLLNSIK